MPTPCIKAMYYLLNSFTTCPTTNPLPVPSIPTDQGRSIPPHPIPTQGNLLQFSSPTRMASTNYSLYAVPAYYVLSLLPHQYAVSTIKAANNGRWNNANSRSSNWIEQIQKSVPAEVFGRYERAEAAHKNSMENLVVFYTALVLGNMAHLPAGTMNTVAGLFLVLRALYPVLYIRTTSHKHSFARTAVWGSSILLCMYTVVRAANVFAFQSTI